MHITLKIEQGVVYIDVYGDTIEICFIDKRDNLLDTRLYVYNKKRQAVRETTLKEFIILLDKDSLINNQEDIFLRGIIEDVFSTLVETTTHFDLDNKSLNRKQKRLEKRLRKDIEDFFKESF